MIWDRAYFMEKTESNRGQGNSSIRPSGRPDTFIPSLAPIKMIIYKATCIKTMFGKRLPEETLIKIATANRRRKRSVEIRSRMSVAQIGHPVTQEARKNMSIANKAWRARKKLLSDQQREIIPC